MTSTAASAPVRSLQLLALALLALLHSANAATDVLQGDIHLMDSVNQISNYTNLKAGQSYVAVFQVDAQPSNATSGTVFGFCTVLRDVGPSQCQYTIQLASGSVQVFMPQYSLIDLQPSYARVQEPLGMCRCLLMFTRISQFPVVLLACV